MVRIEDVWKGFKGKEVLKGIDINIEEGKTYVILGRSGVGKTVLLKLISGLIKPDRGSIFVNNRDITVLDEKELLEIRKILGVVFQEGALFDSLNVFENVGFFLIEHTELKREEIAIRVKNSLSLVGLSGVEHLYPEALSSGMKKRVALARAIITNPKIILYDEPTVGLDPITKSGIKRLIKDLSENPSMTSIVVTHDIELSYFIADKIALLHEGRIIVEETPEMIKGTDNPYLLEFIKNE